MNLDILLLNQNFDTRIIRGKLLLILFPSRSDKELSFVVGPIYVGGIENLRSVSRDPIFVTVEQPINEMEPTINK